ncbi:protein phosphatase 1 regulatory subunit 37-like [Pristis pectinata]|uniref:protein phosphatase 1 regulatory subunit 37-like n=1 Tax=Pristis pectinata TaxID=685728 RepID=UPI00223DC022|nr:protein phosphatase 1 regulatory subunit 37-like [Pristis pectinata]
MEACDTPEAGGTIEQRDPANLAAGKCHTQCLSTAGEVRIAALHQPESNANLRVPNCHSQVNNNLGEADQEEMRVSNSPLKGQSHQQNNTNLGGGIYHSQSNNNLEEADQEGMEISNCHLKGLFHQRGNNANVEKGRCHSQSYNALREDEGCSPGSGDHQCQGEVEVNEIQTRMMLNSRSEVTEGEQGVVHLQNGKNARDGTGDCLLEREDSKGLKKEQAQDGGIVLATVSESSTETGRIEAASECMAKNRVPTQEPEGASQEVGENGDEDISMGKRPAIEKLEGMSPELALPEMNNLEKECTTEVTLEEQGRRQETSEVCMREKFTQSVSMEAVAEDLENEAVEKSMQLTRTGESGREGSSQTLELSVVQQEVKSTSGQAVAEQDVKDDFKLILEAESSVKLQEKECGEAELGNEESLQTAVSTDKMSTSPCADCPGHSAPPRVPLDMLSPLGNDIPHPLALIPPSPDQADDPTSLLPTADGRGKQAVKRVTFPSDEAIVSGAVEPKDPWRHAQNVTVEEIIAAYRKACQKLNCKPINKLLKQIQEFKHLSQRLDCLDLKGEKLDYKGSEALEEVFKRVQFKLVDLEATNLDEDGASALFDMIEYYESATQLNISFNKHIGTRGWQAAAHMMRKTNCLQYLDARNTPLLDHSAPFVARALRISSSLVVLHLENASLSGRPLMLLATALKMNMTLRELFLADNKLNGLQDSAQLGNLLKFNCTIQLMDLRNNHILDSGLAYISDGLKEQRQGLVTLVLWNNQLTHNGMTYMAAALPYTLSLETLNLGHNAIGNEGVHKLKDGLIANRSVLRLGLASTKLTCEGAVAVAEFIADSPRLLRLDLRENEIKTGGLMALSLALKVNHSLLRLDLDREPKKETVKSFIETQKALLTEIQNGCKRNFILAKEKEEKEQKMRQSASMPEITVTLCDKTEEPQNSQACTREEGSGNGDAQEGIPIVTGDTEVLESVGESGVTPPSVECNTHLAAQDESVPQPGVVEPLNSEQHLQHQGALEMPSGKKSVTDSEVDGGIGPATVGNQHAAPELQSAGSESPVAVRSPVEIPSRNNERLVSSPGRGHKVFVVTRVESPPEDPNNRDVQWVKEALQSKKNRAMDKETESSSEPFPGSVPDATAAVTVPAPASEGSLQSRSPLNQDKSVETTGHDFETVCANDCDHVMHGTTLPNGLKADLMHRLPESVVLATGRDGKAVSCNVEQEFTTPKTEKELEELLLEASQETCRETS